MNHSPANDTNGLGGRRSPPTLKRVRAKQACEPCRLRKRRCDSRIPCNMCTQFEYKCYYEKHSRKRSKIVEQHVVPEGSMVSSAVGVPKQDHGFDGRPSTEDITRIRSLEANSGIAFTRLLGMRLDPSSGPKLFTFGWNLGTCVPMAATTAAPITSFLEQDQMLTLATLYFAYMHPLYGFLNQDWIMANIPRRWSPTDICDVPDHLLCGVAAIGVQFSDGELRSVLPRLVATQKQILESTSTMQPPVFADVQSWLLRTFYLRLTDHPHAVWMASCGCMHLIEALGLQFEDRNSILHPALYDGSQDPEIRRRTFWIARMLNTWVSFEYGHTRTAIRGITARLPTARERDYTAEYVNLYSISVCLDPEVTDKQSPSSQWEDFLNRLEAYESPHDCIALSRANLALCGYRRLRLANPNIGSDTVNKIIRFGLDGLAVARRFAEQGLPWWHVGNVPFQVVCVFLAMDARESLHHIPTAMRTLEFVAERFDTVAMKEALKTARFLVRLSKKKKDEDSRVLELSLVKGAVDADPQPENMLAPAAAAAAAAHAQVNSDTPASRLVLDPPTAASGSEDWSLDVLNNPDFDWNFFLTAEMPAFNTFAPDGTM